MLLDPLGNKSKILDSRTRLPKVSAEDEDTASGLDIPPRSLCLDVGKLMKPIFAFLGSLTQIWLARLQCLGKRVSHTQSSCTVSSASCRVAAGAPRATWPQPARLHTCPGLNRALALGRLRGFTADVCLAFLSSWWEETRVWLSRWSSGLDAMMRLHGPHLSPLPLRLVRQPGWEGKTGQELLGGQ